MVYTRQMSFPTDRDCDIRAAEMLDSLRPLDHDDTDLESPMDMTDPPAPPANPYIQIRDPAEVVLEAQESYKYLLAKSYFDTREYDRCAAVFLPPSTPPVPLSVTSPNSKPKTSRTSKKGKDTGSPFQGSKISKPPTQNPYPKLSQKSLFLALYAKYLAGEKRKDEETEMVLGPADGGMAVNRELSGLARGLDGWLSDRTARGLDDRGQGWLEYLYAVVLLKGRNEELAKKWLIRSVHKNPYHWGAWQELNDLLGSTEDVSILFLLILLLLFSNYSAAETNPGAFTPKRHEPGVLCLLQSRVISSDRRHISVIIRAADNVPRKCIPQDTTCTTAVSFQRYFTICQDVCLQVANLIQTSRKPLIFLRTS